MSNRARRAQCRRLAVDLRLPYAQVQEALTALDEGRVLNVPCVDDRGEDVPLRVAGHHDWETIDVGDRLAYAQTRQLEHLDCAQSVLIVEEGIIRSGDSHLQRIVPADVAEEIRACDPGVETFVTSEGFVEIACVHGSGRRQWALIPRSASYATRHSGDLPWSVDEHDRVAPAPSGLECSRETAWDAAPWVLIPRSLTASDPDLPPMLLTSAEVVDLLGSLLDGPMATAMYATLMHRLGAIASGEVPMLAGDRVNPEARAEVADLHLAAYINDRVMPHFRRALGRYLVPARAILEDDAGAVRAHRALIERAEFLHAFDYAEMVLRHAWLEDLRAGQAEFVR